MIFANVKYPLQIKSVYSLHRHNCVRMCNLEGVALSKSWDDSLMTWEAAVAMKDCSMERKLLYAFDIHHVKSFSKDIFL